MKRPAFQFYPADWRKDSALQLCSLAARGLWLEMICLMHEAQPYGCLVVAGKAVSLSALSRLVGAGQRDVAKLLAELKSHDVFSEDDCGVFYSRRMVRDEKERMAWKERQDRHRDKSRDKGRDKPRDKPPDTGPPVTPVSRRSSSSSSSSSAKPSRARRPVDNSTDSAARETAPAAPANRELHSLNGKTIPRLPPQWRTDPSQAMEASIRLGIPAASGQSMGEVVQAINAELEYRRREQAH